MANTSSSVRIPLCAAVALAAMFLPTAAFAEGSDTPPASDPPRKLSLNPADWLPRNSNNSHDFSTLSIEDLMNIEVTSVSKQKQRISDVAAAVYVITQEDIQHTHYQNIARIAPPAAGRQRRAGQPQRL